jgi:hypothetical protein
MEALDLEPTYSLRIEKGEYVVYGDCPRETGFIRMFGGSTGQAPRWLEVVLGASAMRDEEEPIWAFLDSEFRLLSFKR